MKSRNLLELKTVVVLLVILVLNGIAFFYLLQMDSFVHKDLYSYGLVFNYAWANEYWRCNQLAWTFLWGATALVAFSIVPHYMYSEERSRFSKTVGFFLPTFALAYQVLSIFFLSQTGSVVLNTLNLQGIADTIDLTLVYDPVVGTAFALMGIAVVMLFIPMIRALDIIEIEIVDEIMED